VKTALVIEDQRPVRDSIGDLLRLSGFDVRLVGDGHAASQALASRRYDVITLDLHLPSLDGVSLAEALMEEGPNRGTPVVVISAYLDDDTVSALKACGIEHFFSKPFDAKELVGTIQALGSQP
jgi:DNA-binding response OmpR family regulator